MEVREDMKRRSVIGRAAIWAAGVVAATFIGVGCGGDASSNVIRVGVAGPFTGSAAAFGEQIRMGADLALTQRNERGGLQGRTIELAYGDDQGRDDQASVVAAKFANDPDVVAVIGHFNSICSLAGKPIYAQAQVLQFSPGSTNVDVCRGSDWTFRNLYHDDYQGQSLAAYLHDTLDVGRVAIFYDNDDYGLGLKNSFVAAAEKLGLAVIGVEAYQREATLDFSAVIDKFDALRPEMMFISGLYNEAASIVKQAREKGIETPFIGGDGAFSPALLDIGGEAVEGMLITTPFIVHPDIGGPAAQAFRESFHAKYNRNPDTWAALSYDALNQLFAAIDAVGTDRTEIRDHFARTNTPERAYQGVTGATYFDEHGDCLKPAYVAVVQDGEFVPAAKQIETP